MTGDICCATFVGVSRREILFLRDELTAMNALLEKLDDAEELDLEAKHWRNQVREMAYDIEDCIDDFTRLGKTTLASQVYREVGGQFHCKVFVSVSQKPDMVRLLTSVLLQLKQHPSHACGVQDLINSLRKYLLDKSWFHPPFLNLEKLDLLDWTFSKVPRWTGHLHSLRELALGAKQILQEDVSMVGTRLPFLVHLSLRIVPGIPAKERGIIVAGTTGFRALRFFCFDSSKMSNLAFEAGAMPQLRRLLLGLDPLEWDEATPIGLDHLSRLEEIRVLTTASSPAAGGSKSMKDKPVLVKDVFQSAANALSSRPSFIMLPRIRVMNPLLAKLTTLMGDEYKFKGLRKEVSFLKYELNAMKALLEKMDNTDDLDPQAKNWRRDIIDMTYDIEDYIDDFMHHFGEANDKVGILQKASHSLRVIKDRYRIANKIQEIKSRVLEASERRMRYKVDECISIHISTSIDPRLSALYKESTNLVGIDKQKEHLVKLIGDEGQQLKVVSIVGFGGLGKTTLANEVYVERIDLTGIIHLPQLRYLKVVSKAWSEDGPELRIVVPRWIGALNNLRSLRLGLKSTSSCWEEDVGITGRLPSLVELWLRLPIALTERIVICCSTGFTVLEQLMIDYDGMSYVTFEAGAMPSL
nr:unnamed protein product [Digitaria exilis]